MHILKFVLMLFGLIAFGTAASLVCYDVYLSQQLRRLRLGRSSLIIQLRDRAAAAPRSV